MYIVDFTKCRDFALTEETNSDIGYMQVTFCAGVRTRRDIMILDETHQFVYNRRTIQ